MVSKKSVKGAKVDVKTDAKPISFNAKYIAYAHAIFAYTAFFSALVIGCWLHYEKIVKNSSFGYPDEWFPSVSATIGDRYPERSVFQIFIAVTSGPRFLLIFCNFLLNRSWFTMICGLLRTFTCGGWVYITSTDDHDWHDIFMISYIVLTIPWTAGTSYRSPKSSFLRRGRSLTAITFFATLVPLVYWFIQHKVHVRAGAYSIYAYFEWSLILLDVAFDTWSIIDFGKLTFTISEGSISYNVAAVAKPAAAPVAKDQKEDDFTFVQFVVHTVNSFILWSILTSLFLCVWYFPLWDMGISGYEACIVVLFLAPLVLVSSYTRCFFTRFPFIPRLVSVLFGLGAYKCFKPKEKLLSISVGTFFGVLSFVSELTSLSSQPKKYTSYSVAFVLGLLASSVIKFMYYSNNPLWAIMHKPNGGINDLGIFLGVAGSFLTPSLRQAQQSPESVKPSGGSVFLAALGFGGIFFSLFAYLTDTSTLVFWNWSGFPITGPTPITGALINVLAISGGLLFSFKGPSSLLTSLPYNIVVGGASAVVLYIFEDWVGFAGATVFSFYLISVTPFVFRGTMGYNPALVFSLAFFFTIAIALASVWIVAYAFVPGGPLLRERTDIILFGSYAMVLAGVVNYKYRIGQQSGFVAKKLTAKATVVISILLSITIAVTFNRYPPPAKFIKPYNPESKAFNAGIWCVHFGLDNDMWSSHDRMRDLIQDAELDIIGLLETDTERLIGGNRDFTQKIAEDLNMYVDYGPGPHKHTWGAALLSKFPIVKSKHHLLPSPVGELAPAIEATLDIYGELVDVVVVHSGQEEDVEDRRLQSLAVEQIMADSPRPLVLLSYLVTKPLEGNYFTYASEKSRMHDIDSTDWDRWCEYIMFRDLKKVAYARISRSTITDTELQVAKFRSLSPEEKEEMDLDFLYGNHFVPEKKIPGELKMPGKFKNKGIRGHKYHVFKKPRYFALNKEDVEQ